MANPKLAKIMLVIEYAVQAAPVDVGGTTIDMDPEQVRALRPIETQVFVIDQPQAVGDEFVLGLQSIGDSYHLFRRADEFSFGFDASPPMGTLRGGALKIAFTTHDDQADNEADAKITSVSYFPILPDGDNVVEALPSMGIEWKLLVKKIPGPETPTYQLHSIQDLGEGAGADDVCVVLECPTTNQFGHRVNCFFRGCYL